MNQKSVKLVSSNPFKLLEFKRFGLDIDIEKGLDLKEVLGTSEEVVIHKAIEAGHNLLVEDTILTIDGKEVVDIREKINSLSQFENSKAIWTVSLACVIQDKLYVTQSSIEGVIKPSMTDINDAFGFDPFFYPNHSDNLSLHALEKLNLKDNFSARKNAIQSFINKSGNFKTLMIKDIKPWDGNYQRITK